MLGVIIDPTRSEKNLQVAQQVSNDEQHQNHSGKSDDHFFTDGGAIKRGESSHEGSTLSFFALAFNRVPASEHRLFSLRASGVLLRREV
jgi:hypothetical protein